jgi:hypothetical protein
MVPHEIRSLRSATSATAHTWEKPDAGKAGRDIYQLLNIPAKKQTAWKRQRDNVEIKPDYLYSPREVAAILSVSYDTAMRTMERMGRTANLAKPRSKKRLLRVKGSDLRDYLRGKLSG